MNDLLVLGGGPAGLGAAYRAARAGHRVTLLERAPVPGGAAASLTVAGLRVDHGSHRLHPTTAPRILAELQRLLGNDLQVRRRNGRIRLGGRWIAFPLRPRDLALRLPPSFAAGAAKDAALAWTRRPREDTFAEVLRAGLGPTMCARFYFPYARKLWGLEPAELSGEQARRRVRADSPGKLVGRVLRGQGGQTGGGTFFYPRTGFGTISERLAEAAEAAGADLRFGTAASDVELRPDGVRVLAGGTAHQAAHLLSTIPLAALARLGTAEERVLAAAAGLQTRAMTLVYLVLATRQYTLFDAHYLPEAGTPVTRISEPRNYRDGPDPDDRTVLCAELPCAQGDGTWTASPAALAEIVIAALRDAGLPEAPVMDVEVRRLAHAYPVYRVGYERHFAALDAWAGAQPRLLTFGRQGLFAHDNTHHALAMAWDAVDALRDDGGVDQTAWSAARARFREHVVED